MKVHNYTAPDVFSVLINGTPLPDDSRSIQAQFIMDNWSWVQYPVPTDLLRCGENEMTIKVESLNPAISATPRLDNVELAVFYSN